MLNLMTFLIFTGLVAFIAYWKTHNDRMDSSEAYFLGGRSLTAWVIAGSLILTNLSTEFDHRYSLAYRDMASPAFRLTAPRARPVEI